NLYAIISCMKTIQDKTIQELELNTVLETIAGLCVTEKGKDTTTEIRPIVRKDLLMKELKRTSEYTSSFSNNNAIPSHFFENIDRELKFLKVENSFLEPDGFKRINDLVKTTNQLYLFLRNSRNITLNCMRWYKILTSTKRLPKRLSKSLINMAK